ncbi:SCP2 sterol-binding domain-containing protein [Marinicella sp. S1101]|uniref:ubiquinone biosynthesis accessory factor UbiJ n=1 Tax=Marinicella marina TaxID=2996016 RepID=UPI002260D2B6|nr:SCP2 sterol-binding domain-containing protein [Marinicella marina]MCX7554427.1 SCP2 sterol-binding domain-containing protein [Marinicella marina]MDJ1140578.1 SCP2 sterol-binding domain-containing protein [Marinicella marina]
MNETDNQQLKSGSTMLAKLLSNAIQKLLKYDQKSSKKLTHHADKKVKITIQPINQSVVVCIHEDTLSVETDTSIEVDTTISGKPTALFAMSTNQHIPGLDGVSINGDATTGQFMADFLKQLEPDWEEAWCDLLGEVPGYHVNQFIKSIKSAGSNLINSFQTSSKEYLLEENRELVSPREMEAFLDNVDDLRADTDRIERKIKQITQTDNP